MFSQVGHAVYILFSIVFCRYRWVLLIEYPPKIYCFRHKYFTQRKDTKIERAWRFILISFLCRRKRWRTFLPDFDTRLCHRKRARLYKTFLLLFKIFIQPLPQSIVIKCFFFKECLFLYDIIWHKFVTC